MAQPATTDELDYKKGSTDAPAEYMAKMRAEFQEDLANWSAIRKDFRDDLRFVSGNPADQWDPNVKSSRDDDGIPALTMDGLNPLVNQIVNQARKDRPQPKVAPGDGGNPETAEILEGKMRHVMYESHADIAFDYAEAYCASGGFGFYRITKERVGGRTVKTAKGGRVRIGNIFEPRVKRIQDPLTVIFDSSVQELDYSDARRCFIPKKYDRKEFKKEFGVEPIPFPFEDDAELNWGDESKVVAAEYWWVDNKKHRIVVLFDGTEDIADEIEFEESEVIDEYEVIERIIHCDIVDGARRLEESIWEGNWIPIIPVVAKEVVSGGKRRYVSAVRYSRDPQIFINASSSSTAEKMATINMAPYTGPKGAFKDRKWRDGKRHFYLEYEVQDSMGRELDKPERQAFEPAIQGSVLATSQGIDAQKRAIGYVDTTAQPSQADLSGIAVLRRNNQQALANIQYEDSLTDSMWHCGRVMVDLLIALADTPRVWDTRSESGESSKVPVTMSQPSGTQAEAPGYEGQPHTQIDDGDYGVVIEIGPSYATKNEEGNEFLLKVVEMDPALLPIYLPAIFKRFGYEDLAEIATAAQPPQIQQAIAQASGKGIPPQVLAAQVPALTAENNQLKQALQQISQVLKTKQIETQGKLAVQNAKTQGDLEVERMQTIRAIIEKSQQHQHDATIHLTGLHHKAAGHMADLFHDQLSGMTAPEPQEPQPGKKEAKAA